MKALYVEPTSKTEWNRPAVTSAMTAYEFLIDAANDYAVRQRYTTPAEMLKHVDSDLYNALEQLPERPILHPPDWPQMPDS